MRGECVSCSVYCGCRLPVGARGPRSRIHRSRNAWLLLLLLLLLLRLRLRPWLRLRLRLLLRLRLPLLPLLLLLPLLPLLLWFLPMVLILVLVLLAARISGARALFFKCFPFYLLVYHLGYFKT